MSKEYPLARRGLLRLACALSLPAFAHAAPTGIEVLDNAAIPVKNPASVILIAIVRPGISASCCVAA